MTGAPAGASPGVVGDEPGDVPGPTVARGLGHVGGTFPYQQTPTGLTGGRTVRTVKYVHWQEGNAWLGYLQDYPDYWTQGETLDDLLEHLKDLYLDLSGGHVPGARKTGEFVLP